MADLNKMTEWPPPDPGGGTSARRWLIAATVAVVVVGGLLYRGGFGSGQALAPAAEQTSPQAAAVLVVGAADVDSPATDLARKLLAQRTPPAPSHAPTAPANSAPVVHRPTPAAGAPKPSAPLSAPAAETDQAVRLVLAYAPADTRAAIADGHQALYTLQVLDDVVQHGDAVEIFVDGTSYGQVVLGSAGQDVLIPLPSGMTAKVRVVATQDGGGGVSFGVTTSQGEIRSPILAVGESDDWSVTSQ
jgi:hypothetical protein